MIPERIIFVSRGITVVGSSVLLYRHMNIFQILNGYRGKAVQNAGNVNKEKCVMCNKEKLLALNLILIVIFHV